MIPTLILIAAIAVLLTIEAASPRQGPRPLKGMRWIGNASLGLMAYGIGRFVFGASLIGVSLWGQGHGFGALNVLPVPQWLSISLSIIVLDFTLWGQHAIFHMVPWLWPLHRVHHSDDALDVTSAWRFHPLEIVVSLGVKAAIIALMGVPVAAIIVFELLLAISAMFNHAHMRLPHWLDHVLSIAIVTPDMHRVHHGIHGHLDRTNYGFFLNLWDRVFQTYRRMPALETDLLELGSDAVPSSRTLPSLLAQPFAKDRRTDQ